MREIKFRAWEKNLKGIIPVHSIDFITGTINTMSAWRFISEVELMQFTGLFDKNSKEVYEGDIVMHEEGLNIIVYKNAAFVAEIITSYDGQSNDSYYAHELENACTVVGNIYENPELLKEAKQCLL